MKNLTYAQFMNEVENVISALSKDDLKARIMHFAEKQGVSDRNNFLETLKEGLALDPQQKKATKKAPVISPEKLLERIKNYKQRMLDGEFYDEERSNRAYDREEHESWGNHRYDDYYDDEIDFSDEPYVLELREFLEDAKNFFRNKDIKTAVKAYEMLFAIIDNPEYRYDEYFIYGFTFTEALGQEVLSEHKTIYLRCQYLKFIEKDNLKAIYSVLMIQNKILLSDVIEIERSPLPKLDEFIDGLIKHLKVSPQHDRHLIDALFVKGEMKEIKKFAYANGKEHPPVFLYYYQYAKEKEFKPDDLLKIILDGIKTIPQKYQTRASLSLDLIELSKKANDKKNLLLGYSTAFYSNPTLTNLVRFLDFIISEKNNSQRAKLKEYLSTKEIKKLNKDNFSHYDRFHNLSEEIYALNSASITTQTLLIGRYILEGYQPLLNLIKPTDYLGFSGKLKYVAVSVSLLLKSISKDNDAVVVDALINHYCCAEIPEERVILQKLIANSAGSFPVSKTHLPGVIQIIETLAIKRVSHILENKLRGGYDSACLLLVACAEAKEILGDNGNRLIQNIDTRFKRFSAFRKPLKDLSSDSKYLISIR